MLLPFRLKRMLALGSGLALSIASLSAFAAIPQYNVTALGACLSTTDAGKSINNSGAVAFTYSTAIYLWKNNAAFQVGNLHAGNGPLDINDNGDLSFASELNGYIYRNNELTQIPNFYGKTLMSYTFPQSINNKDEVVGDTYDDQILRYRAFYWANGTINRLSAPTANGEYPKGASSVAFDINNNGIICGTFNEAQGGSRAVRWTGGVALALNSPAFANQCNGYGINESGHIAGSAIGSDYYDDYKAVLWKNNDPILLGELPNMPSTIARAVNASDWVVGDASWSKNDTNSSHAFLWIQGQMYDLNSLVNDPHWVLSAAYDINDSGMIVGVGYYNDTKQSFLLTPVPEPGSLSLLALLPIVMMRPRRSSKFATRLIPN